MPSYNRYMIEHPGITPNNIKASKDFIDVLPSESKARVITLTPA
jgi:hypothetical protein